VGGWSGGCDRPTALRYITEVVGWIIKGINARELRLYILVHPLDIFHFCINMEISRARFSWWEAWGPVAYLGFQKGGQSLPSSPSFPFLLRCLVGGPLLVGGLGPAHPKSGPRNRNSKTMFLLINMFKTVLFLCSFFFACMRVFIIFSGPCSLN